ncbi:MAG TPA: MBL fold metallo-hydrolase, partial [Acidimicrobiales bacterium]|nr:MBL fold metallo-hydrolase [Acidimicrobiales bacterium]
MRGSCPCGGEDHRRYGGNTACVVVEVPGTTTPLILDLGTGLRGVGLGWPEDRAFQGVALVSHLHWDHLQGLPFFSPLDREGAVLDVYGPAQEDASLAASVKDALRPPYFPVRLEDLAGQVRFHDLGEDDLALGDAKVRVRAVPHLGTNLGYRVELGGVSLAYVSDHQAPRGLDRVDDAVLEL